MNRMSMPSWDRIKAVFAEACELPAEQVPAFLDRVCEGDAELRREVESLLAARSGKQVATGGAARELAAASTMRSAIITEGAGTIIGPYKLLQLIGEGGFGSVFLAEQTQPVRRRVAVKIIKLGMDTKQVIARFEAERQALALMDHPHIAKVLDGGATPLTERGGGRPYFVMEYVVGDAITAFADAHKLTIRDRLDLFQQVCSAVQHAHTKGIIHRDLKPGNVLVTMVDGKPFAKVIDFGIAKATAGPGGLTDKTLFTEHRQLIGTPEYMSPEQAEGSPDIDTRTDVYALGVLLYELLTGETPFDGARLRSAAYAEIQRIIKDEEPPSPSQRLSRSLDTIAATAAARQMEPEKLRASVHGELDWIVMRALDKERGRRYESANSLADDVRRHMAGEAVVAAPVSRMYRLRKLVRRNRGPVAAVSGVILALAAGGSIAVWQASVAAQQAGFAQQEAAARLAEQNKVAESVNLFVQGALSQNLPLGIMQAGDASLEITTGPSADELRTVRIVRGATPRESRVVGLDTQGNEVPLRIAESVDAINTLTAMTIGDLRRATDLAAERLSVQNISLARVSARVGDYERAAQLLRGERGNVSLELDRRWAAWELARASRQVRVMPLAELFPPEASQLPAVTTGVSPTRIDPSSGDVYVRRGSNFVISTRFGTVRPYTPNENDITRISPNQTLPDGRSITLRSDRSGRSLIAVDVRDVDGNVVEPLDYPQGIRVVVASTLRPEALIALDGGEIVVVDLSSTPARTRTVIRTDTDTPLTMEYSIDGKRILVVTGDWVYREYVIDQRPDVTVLQADEDNARRITFNEAGDRFVTIGYEGIAKMWGYPSLELQGAANTFSGSRASGGTAGRVEFIDESTVLASNPRGAACHWTFQNGQDGISQLEWPSGTNALVVRRRDRAAFVSVEPDSSEASQLYLAAGDGHRIAPFLAFKARIYAMTMDQRSETLFVGTSPYGDASASDPIMRRVELWDVSSKTLIRTLDNHKDGIRDLQLSTDGSLLAVASRDGTATIWDWQSGVCKQRLVVREGNAHTNIVTSVAFHPTEPIVATLSHDCRLIFWSIETGRELAILRIDVAGYGVKSKVGPVKEVRFAPDGRSVLVAVMDNIWVLDLHAFDYTIDQLMK